MTTLIPLSIVALVIAALTQLDDPITAGATLLLAVLAAGYPFRPRPHRPSGKII